MPGSFTQTRTAPQSGLRLVERHKVLMWGTGCWSCASFGGRARNKMCTLRRVHIKCANLNYSFSTRRQNTHTWMPMWIHVSHLMTSAPWCMWHVIRSEQSFWDCNDSGMKCVLDDVVMTRVMCNMEIWHVSVVFGPKILIILIQEWQVSAVLSRVKNFCGIDSVWSLVMRPAETTPGMFNACHRNVRCLWKAEYPLSRCGIWWMSSHTCSCDCNDSLYIMTLG